MERYGEPFEFVSLKIEDAFDLDWWVQSCEGKLDASRLDMNISEEGNHRLHLYSHHYCRLTPSRHIEIPIVPSQTSTSSSTERLQHHLSALPSSSSLPTVLFNLTRVLLQYTAAQYGCSHLILGTSMTAAGTGLIANIASGDSLGEFNEGELWSSPKKTFVHVSRPLRDVGMKECAAVAWWSQLDVVGKDRANNGAGQSLGISALTRGICSYFHISTLELKRSVS